MHRDFDLVVTILGAFRDAPTPALSGAAIKEASLENPAEPLADETIQLHLEILEDAGLVKRLSPGSTNGDALWRITWKGYDALDQDEEDEEDDEDYEGADD